MNVERSSIQGTVTLTFTCKGYSFPSRSFLSQLNLLLPFSDFRLVKLTFSKSESEGKIATFETRIAHLCFNLSASPPAFRIFHMNTNPDDPLLVPQLSSSCHKLKKEKEEPTRSHSTWFRIQGTSTLPGRIKSRKGKIADRNDVKSAEDLFQSTELLSHVFPEDPEEKIFNFETKKRDGVDGVELRNIVLPDPPEKEKRKDQETPNSFQANVDDLKRKRARSLLVWVLSFLIWYFRNSSKTDRGNLFIPRAKSEPRLATSSKKTAVQLLTPPYSVQVEMRRQGVDLKVSPLLLAPPKLAILRPIPIFHSTGGVQQSTLIFSFAHPILHTFLFLLR